MIESDASLRMLINNGFSVTVYCQKCIVMDPIFIESSDNCVNYVEICNNEISLL